MAKGIQSKRRDFSYWEWRRELQGRFFGVAPGTQDRLVWEVFKL
jgi:hypothetical protein